MALPARLSPAPSQHVAAAAAAAAASAAAASALAAAGSGQLDAAVQAIAECSSWCEVRTVRSGSAPVSLAGHCQGRAQGQPGQPLGAQAPGGARHGRGRSCEALDCAAWQHAALGCSSGGGGILGA
jgi:hypothetical protein